MFFSCIDFEKKFGLILGLESKYEFRYALLHHDFKLLLCNIYYQFVTI